VIGEVINNYQVLSLLGEGGMGAVYLAEHPFMGRQAAIKVLRREFAEDRGLVERFMNEARAANAIRHPTSGWRFRKDGSPGTAEAHRQTR
jgi:eukaryotic-like serine/threonine-protein kinase